MMKKFYKAKTDAIFKTIFCKESNRDLLKQLIKEAINEEVDILDLKVPELPKDNVQVKGKTLDVLVKTKEGEINIEINTNSDMAFHRRNAGYIFQRYSNSLNVGDNYLHMPRFIQINLTDNLGKNYPKVARYVLYDKENKMEYIDNLEIYEINLQKWSSLCYNKGEETIIGMLVLGYDELMKINGDEKMEKLKDEVIKLNNDEDFVKFLSDEDEERLMKNTFIEIGREEGREEGHKEGREEGIKENTINLAINMLKKGLEIEIISEITGLTVEEISKLRKKI